MNGLQKRTWAEVSLDNIERNYKAIRARLHKGTRFLGVVKADAYGHGAVPVSRLLEDLGCDYLAVAYLDEGIELRDAGITLPILVFGYTMPVYTPELLKYGLTQTVSSVEMARSMSEICSGNRPEAPGSPESRQRHGPPRLSMPSRRKSGKRTAGDPEAGRALRGRYLHPFAVSDTDEAYTMEQLASFSRQIGSLEAIPV
jgi:alanine racemase